MNSMLHDLIEVGRLTALNMVDEEASGNVAAAAVDATRYGGCLNFEERGLDSYDGCRVGYAQSGTASFSRPQSPLVPPTEARGRGGFRTEGLRQRRSPVPVEVGPRTSRQERSDQDRVFYPGR